MDSRLFTRDITLSTADINTIVRYLTRTTNASSTTALNYIMFLYNTNTTELRHLMYRVYRSLQAEEESDVPSYKTRIYDYSPY